MDKEELIELLKKDSTKVTALEKDKAYIIQIDAGDIDQQTTLDLLVKIRDTLRNFGLTHVMLADKRINLDVYERGTATAVD